jgi:hypothetical protein
MEKSQDSSKQKYPKDSGNTRSFLRFKGIPDSDQTQLCAIAVYLLVMLCVSAVVLLQFTQLSKGKETGSLLLNMIIVTAGSGGIGGTIFCMRGFIKHLIKADFDINYTVWYLFSPFISATLGVMSFLFIFGGLMGLSETGTDVVETLGKWNVTALYMSVAFIAGYAVDEFVTKLHDLSKTLFTKVEEDWEDGGKNNNEKTGTKGNKPK